jgi:hypothetical protein
MLIDAFDTLVFAAAQLGRLREAQQLIGKKPLNEEKQWLQIAGDRLAAAVEPLGDLAQRCARLPELEALRPELARSLQQTAVDTVERLQAGITFHGGPRAPLLEELFGSYKLPVQRRAGRDEFEKFTASFGKRLKTQYVKRILGGPDYEAVQPAVAQVTASFEAWRAALQPDPLAEDEADRLRGQLTVAADTLATPLLQARLLAEAALVTLEGAFAESGLSSKPKKRAVAPKPAPEADAASHETPPPPAEVVENAGKARSKRSAEA